jgi:hypothetical protein
MALLKSNARTAGDVGCGLFMAGSHQREGGVQAFLPPSLLSYAL